MHVSQKQYITAKTAFWVGLIILYLAAGFSVPYLNPLYPMIGILVLLNVFIIVKYPIYGLLLYLVVFLYRPGELYPALAPLRIELILGLLVIAVLIIHQKLKTGRVTLPKDSITISLAAFLSVMILSVFTSYEMSVTIETCKEFLKALIFFFLIVSLVDTYKKFIAFMAVYIIMIGKIAYDAFMLFFTGGFVHAQGIDRLVGMTSAGGDPNAIAATMAITIPIAVATLFCARRFLIKIGIVALVLAMIYLITITGSRGGLLALFGAMMGGFIYIKHKLFTALALTVLLIVGWFSLPDQYRERYETMVNVQDVNDASSGRWKIWQAGVMMIASRPILGVGAGAFRWAAGSGEFGYSRFMQAHNLIIQITATTGLIGLIVWLAFARNLSRKLRELIILSRDSVRFRWAGLYSKAFIASLMALFVAGSFGHNLYRYSWYMIAGLTVAMVNIIYNQIEQDEMDLTVEPPGHAEAAVAAGQKETD